MSKSEMGSYYLVSKHHADYSDFEIADCKTGNPKIWIRAGAFPDISLCFELDSARTLRDTLNKAIAIVEQREPPHDQEESEK